MHMHNLLATGRRHVGYAYVVGVYVLWLCVAHDLDARGGIGVSLFGSRHVKFRLTSDTLPGEHRWIIGEHDFKLILGVCPVCRIGWVVNFTVHLVI